MTINKMVVLAAIALLFGCTAGRPVDLQNDAAANGQALLDAQIAELAVRLLPEHGTNKKLKMVILPFADLEQRVSEFGKYVSEGLVGNLAKTGKYAVVERELLYRILEEQKLGMLGIIDDASAKKVGKILGVDCVVTGTFSALESRIKINARVIATDTGLIMSVAEANIARNKEVEILLRRTRKASAPVVSAPLTPKRKIDVSDPTNPPPVYGKDYYAERDARLRKDAVPVTISIQDFVPVLFAIPASWTECPVHLVSEKPKAIQREPTYEGVSRKYGYIQLGNTDNALFYFALDLISGPHPLLYLDRNQNGDLTDDGGPITNQGTKDGIFSAEIVLPFSRILQGADFPEDYKAWLFTNDTYWQRDLMCFYSKSQLKGKVVLDGIAYDAYLKDGGKNDATFTNKGVYIDINGDGKIEYKTEFFEPNAVAEINNKRYLFKIEW